MKVACDTVFVGNLGAPHRDNEKDLRLMFSKCGVINKIIINSKRKFGFIKFRDISSIHAALSLHGTKFHGNKLSVKIKNKK